MMGRIRGWKRYAGHFILFGAPPCGVGYALFKAGYTIPPWVVYLSMTILTVIVVLMEVDSTKRQVQTVGKAVIDTVSKLSGALIGFLQHYWW